MKKLLLEVKNLRVNYETNHGSIAAVDDVSFALKMGQNIALVGESGCGKTTVSKAILKLLPDNASIKGGEIIFKEQRIDSLPEKKFNRLRWSEIAVVTQSAMNALNPVYRVGDQIIEAIKAHKKIKRQSARKKVEELFRWVGLMPERVKDYPHQFSGGMKQRAIIAMSLALNPSLIIADEPTTALDVVMQDQILEQIVHIQQKYNNSFLLISHDISAATEICQHFVVMYGGKVVESCTVEDFHYNPCHPYSMGLLQAYPSIEGEAKNLISIPGFPPNLSQKIEGCIFYKRCPFRKEVCKKESPPDVMVSPGHIAKCHFALHADIFQEIFKKEKSWETIVS